MTLFKSQQSGAGSSDQVSTGVHAGFSIPPEQTGSRHPYVLKTAAALTLAAVIAILISAVFRPFHRPDAARSDESMAATDSNDRNQRIDKFPDGAVAPQPAVHRVSAPAQVHNLDPLGLLFDLKTVLDQTPEAVAQVLGESPVLWPDDRSVSGALRGKYKRGKIEIGYAGEVARFITIRFSQCKRWNTTGGNSRRCMEAEDFTGYKFRQNIPDLLQALGLPKDQRPSLNSTSVLVWNGASGIHQVSVIPNDIGGINYIHVISSRVYACLPERAEGECQPS